MSATLRFTSALLALTLFLALCLTTYSVDAAPRSVGFKKNCQLKRGAYERIGGGWKFYLRHGDIGGCGGDNRARHRAEYWERSELRSAQLSLNRTYEITFEIQFDPAMSSSDRTSFFQIHSSSTTCKSCYPMLMMKVRGSGSVGAHLLNARGTHSQHGLGISRSTLASGWRTFKVRVGTSTGPNEISIWMDGRKILSEKVVHLSQGGKPYLKVGLYRPGSSKGRPTDSVSIRNVKMESFRQ